MLKFLLYIVIITLLQESDNRPFYLKTEYCNDIEISMNWTAKGNGLENRIAYIGEMVDNYQNNASTTSDAYNNLSFDKLPLDVYEIGEVDKYSAWQSRTVYSFTYHITHFEKSAWFVTSTGYNYARLTCTLTESDTYCVVAYNEPSQFKAVLVSALVTIQRVCVLIAVVVLSNTLSEYPQFSGFFSKWPLG